MLLSIGNLFPVSFRFVDKFYTQKIVCSAFQSAGGIFLRKLFCLELFLSAKKVSLYNPFFNSVFSEKKFFFIRLFRLGAVCFCGIRVCRAAPLFWDFAVCKENFFCAPPFAQTLFLPLASISPSCLLQRAVSSPLLCFIAPSVAGKRVFIPSGRRRIVEKSSRVFHSVVPRGHSMRIFCPFLSPRRGRADILFRRAVLRSISPFFSPDKAKISRICGLKKFRCANVKFFR